MRHAEAWTQAKFAEWGLVNVHTEGFAFGRGWWVKRASVRMTAPRAIDLAAVPVAWTPGTGGPVSAPVVLAPLRNAGDLAQWRGKLAGKIVLVSEPRDATDPDKPAFRRWTADELAALDVYEAPADDDVAAALASLSFAEQRNAFLKAEGALAFASISPRDGKLLQGAAYQFTLADAPQVPGFEIAAEDYRRLARLLKMGRGAGARGTQRRRLRRRRRHRQQRHRRHPRQRSARRLCDGGRAPRQLGRGRRRRRQWRGQRDGDGGRPHHPRIGHQAPAHDPLRAVGGRGAGGCSARSTISSATSPTGRAPTR